MLPSVVDFLTTRPGPAGERHSSPRPRRLSLLIANADASSIGILSDQRESKGPRLIANLELEIKITAAFSITSIFLIANILRFLALRHEGFVLYLRAMPLSQILIETPRLKLRITRAISTTSNFLIETKCGFCIPKSARVPLSALPCLLASLRPNLCVSVPPWPIFAIMAGSN